MLVPAEKVIIPTCYATELFVSSVCEPGRNHCKAKWQLVVLKHLNELNKESGRDTNIVSTEKKFNRAGGYLTFEASFYAGFYQYIKKRYWLRVER